MEKEVLPDGNGGVGAWRDERNQSAREDVDCFTCNDVVTTCGCNHKAVWEGQRPVYFIRSA